jgi:hypothetical protein
MIHNRSCVLYSLHWHVKQSHSTPHCSAILCGMSCHSELSAVFYDDWVSRNRLQTPEFFHGQTVPSSWQKLIILKMIFNKIYKDLEGENNIKKCSYVSNAHSCKRHCHSEVSCAATDNGLCHQIWTKQKGGGGVEPGRTDKNRMNMKYY